MALVGRVDAEHEDAYLARQRLRAAHLPVANFDAVRAVADELVRRGTINGAEVRRIVAAHEM